MANEHQWEKCQERKSNGKLSNSNIFHFLSKSVTYKDQCQVDCIRRAIASNMRNIEFSKNCQSARHAISLFGCVEWQCMCFFNILQVYSNTNAVFLKIWFCVSALICALCMHFLSRSFFHSFLILFWTNVRKCMNMYVMYRCVCVCTCSCVCICARPNCLSVCVSECVRIHVNGIIIGIESFVLNQRQDNIHKRATRLLVLYRYNILY